MKKVKDKKVIKMEKKLKKNKVIRRIKKLGFKGIIKEFLDLIKRYAFLYSLSVEQLKDVVVLSVNENKTINFEDLAFDHQNIIKTALSRFTCAVCLIFPKFSKSLAGSIVSAK